MPQVETITIRDPQTGATAGVAPSRGFNCYSFQPVLDGTPSEVLWTADDFLSGVGKPSRSGIPILFPFAGRIRGTSFEFCEKSYSLPVGDDHGNAIHGFVFNRPWRVIERQDDQVVGEFQASIDDPSVLEQWPADFRLRVGYELRQNRLIVGIEAFNPDSRPLPFWFGTHSYFRVPLAAGSSAGECRVTVPAREYWELDQLLPTGQRRPVAGHRDLTAGAAFAGLSIDDILTDLQFANGVCATSLRDPAANRQLRLSFGPEYSECVVFVPPHRQAVCIEPYTSVSNAFELEAQGVKTGMITLAPSESWQSMMQISVG